MKTDSPKQETNLIKSDTWQDNGLTSSLPYKVFRALWNEGFSGFWRRSRHWLAAKFPGLANRSWIRRYTPDRKELKEMSRQSAAFAYQPLISVILPVYNPKEFFLREALDSVLQQVYPNWELCVADDASTKPYVREILEEYQQRDQRVKVVFRKENGHISKASNSALDLASGEFVALLDHDDVLAPHAFFELARVLNQDKSLDMLYSDEDKTDESSQRSEPTFKAEWAPEYFLSFMYIGHLTAYRRALVEKVGRFRAGFEGSQDYDLALRVSECTDRIGHIPAILYHWRKHPESVAGNIKAKPYAFKVAKKALADAMKRRGAAGAEIKDTKVIGIYRASCPIAERKTTAVFIHAADARQAEASSQCLLDCTSYKEVEVFVGSSDCLNLSPAGQPGRLQCLSGIEYARQVDFWRAALQRTSADQIVLIGAEVQPADNQWLERLLEYFQRDNVGLVGARIVAQDSRIIHAGYTVAATKVSHNFFGSQRYEAGYAARLITAQNVSAVSSDCLLVERSLLSDSGVVDVNYDCSVSYDVDLGLSAARSGKRVVWTPYAKIVRQGALPEKITDLKNYPRDAAHLEKKHNLSAYVDPYYPAGLDALTLDYRMAV